MKFIKALDGYWLEKGRNFSDSTIEDYRYGFRYFVEYLHPGELTDITSDHVRGFMAYLENERGLSEKSCLNYWIALSSFWSWAEMELGVEHIIRGRVAQPKVPPPDIVPYTETEIKGMIMEAKHTGDWASRTGRTISSQRPTAERDTAIIVTLVDTGIRASELCNLKVGNFTESTGRLHVQLGKGKKSRFVFLGINARKAIWKYFATREDLRTGYPLFATRDNTHLDRNNLRNTIKRIADRAGVGKANIHRFRHTFAINFLRNGGTPLELQRLLGHQKMETVMIYTKLAEVDLETAQRTASPADRWRL
jgi:integrase/recombinase XerD